MIVAGQKIAEEIYAEVRTLVTDFSLKPVLRIFTCDPNFETKRYLELKKKKALSLGIQIEIEEWPLTMTTNGAIARIKEAEATCTGMVVQLPLPRHLVTADIVAAITPTHDVDVFGYSGGETGILPPVVGAIAAIAKHHQVTFKDKTVVIFGAGRLVGKPAASYAKSQGAKVVVVDQGCTESEVLALTKQADIVILGVGKPDLLKPEMVKEGVVVFDAGASEDGGVLVGDASPTVADKATLFTPVPGGIGPITVAILFRNLVNLTRRQ